MTDAERRRAIQQHWEASNDADLDAVHAIYHDEVVLEFPQSGEEIRGKQKVRGFRASYPAKLDFSIRRTVGLEPSGSASTWSATTGSRSTPVRTSKIE